MSNINRPCIQAPTLALLAVLAVPPAAAGDVRAGTGGDAGADTRARIVESNLKDLSASNDAAISRHRLETRAEPDALGQQRLVLRPESVRTTDTRVRQDVQSNLHRLRRETASQQTEDGRVARVQDSLDRAGQSEP